MEVRIRLAPNTKRGRWLVAVLCATIVMVVAAGVPIAADPDSELGERLRGVGLARASVKDDKVVAKVGQQSITLADYVEKKGQVAANLAYMYDEIAKQNVFSDELLIRTELIEEAGAENVALAGLIERAALYQRAVEEGYGASEEEVRSAVAKQREIEARPELTQLEGYIQAVGEERFSSELMPAWQRRTITIGKMYAALVRGTDSRDQGRVWAEFGRKTVSNSAINLLDPNEVAPATLKGALDYLDKYWQLSS